MAELPTSNEALKASPEVKTTPKNPQEELLKLKEGVEQKQFDKVVDSLMGAATEKKDVPTAKIDAFVNSLNPAEVTALETFLAGKPADERAAKLRARLQEIPKKDGAPASTDKLAEGLENLSEPAKKVVEALDKGIARITAGGQLNQIAAKIGFKGEIGPKQLEFVKNFFLGYAAKVLEGVTASLRKINPTMDISNILNLPLELRLLNIKDSAQRAKYKIAYLKRSKESTGVFIAPTLEEALAPQVATVQPVAQPVEAKPVTAVSTGEKVEGKRIVKLTDGTIFDVTRGADKKTIIEAAGNKAEVKVAGSEVLDVTALDAKGETKANVTFKLLDNRTVVVDGEVLRNGVQSKKTGEKKEVLASDGLTKIELI